MHQMVFFHGDESHGSRIRQSLDKHKSIYLPPNFLGSTPQADTPKKQAQFFLWMNFMFFFLKHPVLVKMIWDTSSNLFLLPFINGWPFQVPGKHIPIQFLRLVHQALGISGLSSSTFPRKFVANEPRIKPGPTFH